MNITPEEEKRDKRTLFINLIFADLVTGLGLLIYFLAGHKFEMVGFFVTLLGSIWMIMTISKFFKLKKVLASNKNS